MQELRKILEEIDKEENKELSKLQFEVSQRSIDETREYIRGIRYAKDVIRNHINDGWIPVEERLPEEPKENPVFDDKPLELYLVDMGGSYPLRAFWNGKEFTDGWSVLKVTAWMPLPEPYRPERSEE